MTKALRLVVVALFSLILLIPVICFNTRKNVKSDIDNRMLAENPFTGKRNIKYGKLRKDIQKFVNDRLGFRDNAVLAYTVLNDRLFGKMIHPCYTYGKDGWVFFEMWNPKISDVHYTFLNMSKVIQNYCEKRGMKFYFTIEPDKRLVCTDKLTPGFHLHSTLLDDLNTEVKKRNINYVDSISLIREKYKNGEQVFNVKYDAGHYNILAAYYVTKKLAETVQRDFLAVSLNSFDNCKYGERIQKTLLVSKFPINEKLLTINAPCKAVNLTDKFDKHTKRHKYQGSKGYGFEYFENPGLLSAGAPRVLMFQGSHMNGYGKRFLTDCFGAYIHVTNYHNIFDLPYYVEKFKPDVVILEVADRTIGMSGGFEYDKMKKIVKEGKFE